MRGIWYYAAAMDGNARLTDLEPPAPNPNVRAGMLQPFPVMAAPHRSRHPPFR